MQRRSFPVFVRRSAGLGLVVACLLASCGGDPDASDGGSDEVFEAIGPDDPFCSAAVLAGDEVVYAEAVGRSADGPVTVDTPLDIASVSKQFTGVAIELLIDRGDLDGSDLVGELVPASSPATDDLTVDELLVHTSGLVDYTELLPEELDERTTQADAVAAIARSEPSGTRGTFEYSNSNYVLLAEVVEAVSGRTLAEYLDDEVFAPLELDMVLEPVGPWLQVGDGSIQTTPSELVTWSTQYGDQTLAGPELRTAMFDPEADAGDDPEDPVDAWYGSGIMRSTTDDGAEVLFHDGSWGDVETEWLVLPDEQLAAAVTCHADAELDTEEPAVELLDRWRSDS